MDWTISIFKVYSHGTKIHVLFLLVLNSKELFVFIGISVEKRRAKKWWMNSFMYLPLRNFLCGLPGTLPTKCLTSRACVLWIPALLEFSLSSYEYITSESGNTWFSDVSETLILYEFLYSNEIWLPKFLSIHWLLTTKYQAYDRWGFGWMSQIAKLLEYASRRPVVCSTWTCREKTKHLWTSAK